jgi:hypothetical protein
VNAGSHKIWEWINSGLIYVITKIAGAAAGALQAGFMGAMTLADTIAWTLRKGIVLADKTGLTDVSKWVLLLINKIMQALGMGIADESLELTQTFMRGILSKLIDRTNDAAKKAVTGS